MKINKIKINLILSIIIFIFAMIIFGVVLYSKSIGVPPKLFNHSFHLVVSDSMSPEINVGDFVLTKGVDKAEIAIGDYIVFKSPDPNLKGVIILHKVIEIVEVDGEILFKTMGTKLGAPEDPYLASEVYGVFVAKSAFIGNVIRFLSKPINWIFIIFLLIMVKIIIKLIKNTLRIIKEEKVKANEK